MTVRKGTFVEAHGNRRQSIFGPSRCFRASRRPDCRGIAMRLRLAVLLVLAGGIGAPLAAQTPSSPPLTFGTSAVSYIEIPGIAFAGTNSAVSYQQTAGYARYSTTCGGFCFFASLHLPAGARIVSLELDAVDTDGVSSVEGRLTECNRFGGACTDHPAAGAGPADCLLPGQICSGAAFAGGPTPQVADLTPDAITVDNQNESYLLSGGGNSLSSTTAIGGMIVGYVLQVSPAPAVATFGDVPTSSPQFQFVEALVAAGITAGCGGGNYCPNNPVTRGQMAVFLAKALGLQWP
jgi:hypothetical protein